MNDLKILLFYKFVRIENPEEFRLDHLEFCKKLGVLGKVLVGKEGINGSISGTREQTEAYMAYLHSDPRFSNVVFKIEDGLEHPFRKMVVRVKKEIIRMDKEVDMSNTGEYIEADDFLKVVDDKNTIIIDTRNDYEWRVGKFKNALTLDIKNFREFPEAIEKLEHLKDKKIAIYCTGGIRCEKASAYMKQQGFSNVSQLHGGIINFCQQKPNSAWEGSCFVFDNRMISRVGNEENPITSCLRCGVDCDLYSNCRNVKCNEQIIICHGCQDKHQGCCSKECFEEYKKSWHN
ncbi:MAG: rhodanese-related sulfurtransferase [Nanoarchaeota archaeon]